MASIEWYWVVIGSALAFAVAWINGANNAANAIGSAVGAKALSVRKALWLAATFDFLGAIIFGKFVSMTLLKGIVDTSTISSPYIIVVGMTAALFATALWVVIATLLKVPMSISQAIVGGVTGFGIVVLGMEGVNWAKLFEIIASWIYLPFMSIAITFILYKTYMYIMRSITLNRLIIVATIFLGLTIFTTIFLLNVKTLKVSDLAYALTTSIVPALVISGVFIVYTKYKIPRDIKQARDHIFKILLVASCAAMAFSHGANDVANSAGPLAGILYVYTRGAVPPGQVTIPFNALLLSASGIALGILIWGYSVVETIGEKITTLTIETAFIAQFSASIATLIVTRLGLPVSTTVAIVGAITGVGLARGVKSVNFKTLFKIISMWFLGFPVVASITALIVYILS